MDTFEDFKIVKVTPGIISKYITEKKVTSPSRFSLGVKPSSHKKNEIVTTRFKMFLHELRLSKECMDNLRTIFSGDIYVTIKWSLFGSNDLVTSPEKLEHGKTKLDFTMKYVFHIDEDFVANVEYTPMIFRMYALSEGQELFLSEAHFYFDNIRKVANVKQREKILFKKKNDGENVAYLNVWYKFTCKQKILKAFFPESEMERKQSTVKLMDLLGDKFTRKSQNFMNVHVTDSEFDHFADSVWLVLNRNKVLKTTQSDINTELQERVRWLRFEANWKQTLQENAILHGRNPEDVIWRQWREEHTANVRLRTYDNISPQTYKPELSITIVDLYFLKGCPLLSNEDIKRFYVEYSFLGFEGPEMETPYSCAKKDADERIVFNFKKTFPISIEKNLDNCKKLTELIKTDGLIKFTVISEPLEDKAHPIQTCQEIGFVEVPLSELIQLEHNEDTYEYEVIDVNNTIVVLGYLTIKVQGVLAMRKMALDLMAPKGYKLYM